MTRTKENAEKDMRSQINKHFTPGERTFKLKEVTGPPSLFYGLLLVEEKKQEDWGGGVDEE